MSKQSIYAAEAEALLRIFDALSGLEQGSQNFVLKTAKDRMSIVGEMASEGNVAQLVAPRASKSAPQMVAPKAKRGRPKGSGRKAAQPVAEDDTQDESIDLASIDIKRFLDEKDPQRPAEVIACLAYVLTHAGKKRFKTRDVNLLNKQAGNKPFGNPTTAMQIAASNGYLSERARVYQLTPMGHQYVEALPDRDKAEQIRRDAGFVRRGRGRPTGSGRGRNKKTRTAQKQAA